MDRTLDALQRRLDRERVASLKRGTHLLQSTEPSTRSPAHDRHLAQRQQVDQERDRAMGRVERLRAVWRGCTVMLARIRRGEGAAVIRMSRSVCVSDCGVRT